nr:immunoglobulin heavy chain junction region [Macaca mulatta]MOX16549.1 immunoglobulin heavy chain junction region [Macaca mulatta]
CVTDPFYYDNGYYIEYNWFDVW